MDKKYILVASPLNNMFKAVENNYSGKDIVALLSGVYFESNYENITYKRHQSNAHYEILSSRDKTIELIFIIADSCSNIYNGITFNQSFQKQHIGILEQNKIDLVITVVQENSFIEFFNEHWKFFNLTYNVPVISIKKQLSTIDDVKYFGSTYIYNRKNSLIELTINTQENYFIQNLFSQLVYSLINRPELIIYCSSLNKKNIFIKDLCRKFFPHVTVQLAHPHKNNLLVPSKLITSSTNKIILFLLDQEMIDLENLNFFLDLQHSLPERSIISCASAKIENKIEDFMFYKALEQRIKERKQQYYQYAKDDVGTEQCLRNLDLLHQEVSNIKAFLKQGNFFGDDIKADSRIIYLLEKKFNLEFASISIISGVIKGKIKHYITEILEEDFKSIEHYNKYYTINADHVNFTDRGDFHQKN